MNILIEAERIKREFYTVLKQADTSEKIENIRVLFLGRKGKITRRLRILSELPPEERRKAGEVLNKLKEECEAQINRKKDSLEFGTDEREKGTKLDVFLPGKSFEFGKLHPLTFVLNKIEEIFSSFGFEVAWGPEIEDDWHNFTALNIPLNHPARDMHDTFYVNSKKKTLLRTHTSPVQIREMKKRTPPFAIISPGKCYRRDALDASHSPVFHQVEGLWIDENISFSELKGILEAFCKRFFSPEAKLRFRPSYFPFTEPSCEVDLFCLKCFGKGCSSCGNKGYLEILGAGRVHPNVLKNAGYDENRWSGFAFGMGVERIAMLKYGINDIRVFYENSLRFLRSF